MVLPMGLTNALATFMRTMNDLFAELLDRGIIAFFNDGLVYGRTRGKHVQLLRMVFYKPCEHCFYCKLKKCRCFLTTATFLGFDIILDRLRISDTKVKSLHDWHLPTTMK